MLLDRVWTHSRVWSSVLTDEAEQMSEGPVRGEMKF